MILRTATLSAVCTFYVLCCSLFFGEVYTNDELKPVNVSNTLNSNVSVVINDAGKDKDHHKEPGKQVSMPVPIKTESSTTVSSKGSESPKNVTANEEEYGRPPKLNGAALLRGFYVFAGLGMMVAMYIVVRTIRLRRGKSAVRKYGLLNTREDMEMTLLDDDDEDEDTTLFDAKKQITS